MSIELNGVSRRFGKVQALDAVSVQFGGDQIYGLLGANGAGKTTMLSMIADRSRPDAGTVTLDGTPLRDCDAALHRVFLVSEQNFFPEELKVNAGFAAAKNFYPGFDAEYAVALAGKFNLPLRRKINSLSTGYGSIFRLVLGLSIDTPYLLLDEPVLGLDAQHRDLFYRELVARYAEHPRTIVISTHLIAEVENLIEHAVILHRGKILQDAPAAELTANAYTVSGPAALVDAYLAGKNVLGVTALGGLKTAGVQGRPGELPAGLELGRTGLQDYFISLMNREDAQ